MRLVLDAMPLIYLSKAGFFRLLKGLDLELFTSEDVAKEVLLPEFSEYAFLKSIFDSGAIKVKQVSASKRVDGIHKADASVISLAKKLNVPLVSDDREARLVAQISGVEVFYSTFFLFRAISKRIISRKQAVSFLNSMVSSGWRCSLETYVRVREELEK